MAEKHRLGEMLVAAGLITREQLGKALHLQAGGTRRIGYLLIRMGFVEEEQLQTVLSRQLDIPLVRCSEAFSDEVRKILPRHLCLRFNVLPLSLEDNNVLRIAMVDPSDAEAISAIEKYTGKVLEPVLAAQSDITTSIHTFIPRSLKDIFNAANTPRITLILASLALVLIAITILQYNHEKFLSKYGTTLQTETAVIYKNHELTLEFDRSGKVTLRGHGAYAAGPYSIIFSDINSLQRFLTRKKKEFSTDQITWVQWVLSQRQTAN